MQQQKCKYLLYDLKFFSIVEMIDISHYVYFAISIKEKDGKIHEWQNLNKIEYKYKSLTL